MAPAANNPMIRTCVWATSAGFAAILLWSGTFALARSLSEKLGPFTSGAAVYLAGTIFCAAFFLLRRDPRPAAHGHTYKYLLGCGCLFTLYTVLIYAAVGFAQNRLQLLEVALVNYLWPAATVVLSIPLLKQRAHPLLWPATAAALGGVFLVMTQGADVSWKTFSANLSRNPLVYGFALGAALCWALYSNLARRWASGNSRGGVLFFMIACSFALLFIRFFAGEVSQWSVLALYEVLALGLITAVAYELWDTAMRRGNLNLVAAGSYFTPLFSTLVSGWYLGVAPASQVWWGCTLIVIGSLGSWWAVDLVSRRDLQIPDPKATPLPHR